MMFLIMGLGGITSVVILVCYIMTVVKMFQNQDTTYGILSLVLLPCGIGALLALIRAWQMKEEWDMANIVNIWLAAIVINILLNIGYFTFGAASVIPQQVR